jgi:hypothetical protein
VFVVACVALSTAHAAPKRPKPPGSFQISAWTFDRGNAEVFANPDIYADYRDKFPQLVVGKGGRLPWAIEYDINFPVDTTYTLYVCYGSPAKRPMEVWLDNRRVGVACGRVTGNPPPYMDRHPQHDLPRDAEGFHGIEWEEACKIQITKGKHTLKFTRKGLPPRVHKLRLESSVAFPKGWRPDKREVNLDSVQPRCRMIFLPSNSVNVAALQLAIADNIKTFAARYPKGPQFLKQLDELDKKQRAVKGGSPEQKEQIEKALSAVRSEAMLAHPALKFDKLLFVKQKGRSFSTYTGHLTKGGPGGNLCILSPVSPGGKVTELVPELNNGVFGRFDLSFDATRILFCHAKAKAAKDVKDGGVFRIYEIDIDPKTGRRANTALRQITFGGDVEAETIRRFSGTNCGQGYDDIDPCYLPNGKIMFASTRSQRSVLCFPATVTTLYVMDADGKNMRCLSSGQVNEINPCVLDDGRVIYMRWEYVDKGFGNAQSLWAIRPDGSGSDHVYKNSLVRPGSMTNARSVPDSRLIVAVAAGHHGGMAGPIVLIDNRRNRRNAQGLKNLTPEISYPGMNTMTRKSGPFREPYPFSEKFFLVSHMPNGVKRNKGADYGIYTLDAWGNRAELYSDPDLSCHQPTPLRPRLRPAMIAPVDAVDAKDAQGLATMFMLDVYQGLKGIKRGRVKYVRVMEAMNLSWYDTYRAGKQGDGAGMQASAVSLGGDVARKKIYGVATVHEDGSAYFTVPARKNIFFQALDENFMELHRMRTFLNLLPGEKRSCIGCHELRRKAPNLKRAIPMAMTGDVEALRPQPGDTGPRAVHYALDIQPILDKNCVSCHSGKTPKGDLDLTGELTGLWNRSYENLTKKAMVSYLHTCGYGSSHVPLEPPLTFGSHRSKMVERIRKAPCKSKITREDFIKIVTWIDANAPYYGTHRGKKNLRWKAEADFRPLPLAGE